MKSDRLDSEKSLDSLLVSQTVEGLSIDIFLQQTLQDKASALESLTNALLQLWQCFRNAADQEGIELPLSKYPNVKWFITFVFVDDQRMASLNLKYRNKNASTDVLTFPALQESDLSHMLTVLPEVDLGSVFVSLDWAEANVVSEKKSMPAFIVERMVHGLLHSLGFHHDTERDYQRVIRIQQSVIESFFK